PGSAATGPPARRFASTSAASRSGPMVGCRSSTSRTPGGCEAGPPRVRALKDKGAGTRLPHGVPHGAGWPGSSPCDRLSPAPILGNAFQKAMSGLFMTNFQQLFQMGQQVQARLTQLQTELGNRTVTCSSGGGMVTVTADGRGRVREVKIDPAVVNPSDIEMLEDLVTAAVAEAQGRAQQMYEEE